LRSLRVLRAPKEELKDCQLLLRHYFLVDKYHLKDILKNMHQALANCANLTQLSLVQYDAAWNLNNVNIPPYSEKKRLVCDHVNRIIAEVFKSTFSQLKCHPKHLEYLQQFTGGCPTKSTGIFRDLLERRGDLLYLKDPYLHMLLFLHNFGDELIEKLIKDLDKDLVSFPTFWQDAIMLLPLASYPKLLQYQPSKGFTKEVDRVSDKLGNRPEFVEYLFTTLGEPYTNERDSISYVELTTIMGRIYCTKSTWELHRLPTFVQMCVSYFGGRQTLTRLINSYQSSLRECTLGC